MIYVSVSCHENDQLDLVKMPMGYDPCTQTYATEYFNRKDVQKALHADIRGAPHPFSLCRYLLLQRVYLDSEACLMVTARS